MTSTTAARLGLRWIRVLVLINLGLVALKAVAAGFVLSGSGPAVIIHARGALGLGLGALIQAAVAVVLWARGRVPAGVARAGIALFVVVVLQMGAGHSKRYWLHVADCFRDLRRATSTDKTAGRAVRGPSAVVASDDARRQPFQRGFDSPRRSDGAGNLAWLRRTPFY